MSCPLTCSIAFAVSEHVNMGRAEYEPSKQSRAIQYKVQMNGACIGLVCLNWEEEGRPRLPYLSTKFLAVRLLILRCAKALNFSEYLHV
jgi:hypothetical protein